MDHGLQYNFDAPFNIKELSIILPFSYDSTHFNKSHAFIVKVTRRQFLPLRRLYENTQAETALLWRTRLFPQEIIIIFKIISQYLRFFFNFLCVFN